MSDLEDKVFMQRPEDWPRWPYLPVKRYTDHKMETGLIIQIKFGSVEPVVYIGNLFSFEVSQIASVERHEYDSWDALIADGWRVD